MDFNNFDLNKKKAVISKIKANEEKKLKEKK